MRALQVLAAVSIGIAISASSVMARNTPLVPAEFSSIDALPQKGGQQVALDKLPAAVTAAVEKAYPKSTIVTALKVDRGGQVRYQLSIKTSATAAPISVLASADGMIRAAGKGAMPPAGAPAAKGRGKAQAVPAGPQRQMVDVRDLPKAVVNAIKDAYPKDTIIDAVIISTGPPVLYQIGLNDVSSLMPLRVVISSDGTFQKR